MGEESIVNLRTDRFKYSSPGIFGAKPARPSKATLDSQADGERALTSKVAGLRLKHNDVLVMEFGGGGGWGDPRARDVERVRQGVVRGYVSFESARDDYGVALRPDFSIDTDATARLRAQKATA